MLEALTVDDFLPHVGQAVQLVAANGELSAVLREAKATSAPHADGRAAFSLLLAVDAPPTTPQGMYRLVLPGGRALDIFFVPIGRGEHGLEMEAIFG